MLTYIIDDEPISLFLTEQVLRMEGVTSTIRTFYRAEEALRFLLAHLAIEVPEVILLDLNMPMMNGWDFLEALAPHATSLAGRCRIYVLTSSLVLADTARATSYALVTGIIHKPLDENEIRGIRQAAIQSAAA
jgi:response regulator RpfG family c-di-GMP phosphodiesterase